MYDDLFNREPRARAGPALAGGSRLNEMLYLDSSAI